MATTPDWRESNAELILGHQRARADNAKLIATFSVAIAATLVATALQVPDDQVIGVLRLPATLLLGVAVLGTAIVIFLDRIRAPDIEEFADGSLSQTDLVVRMLAAQLENERTILGVQIAAVIQLVAAAAASGVAAYALLVQ
jgi:hypothetical protein